jgi:acyl carrier protein
VRARAAQILHRWLVEREAMEAAANELVVKEFIVKEFLPDAQASELETTYDLFGNGVIDSLGLLRFVSWLEQRFDVAVDDVEITPDNFRTIEDVIRFVERSKRASA